MNWITTNIRIPEDVYMDLKYTAVRERKSIAGLIREKLGTNSKLGSKQELQKRMKSFAKRMAKKYPNTNLSEKLIEMRYEQ